MLRRSGCLILRKFIVVKVFVVNSIVCLLANIEVSRQEVKLRATFVVIQLSHHIVEIGIIRLPGGFILSGVRHIWILTELTP
jgi:hypothetical protein